jgi:integrase
MNASMYSPFTLDCGLGELPGLRWRDVDLIAGWLEVSASLTGGGQRRPQRRRQSAPRETF